MRGIAKIRIETINGFVNPNTYIVNDYVNQSIAKVVSIDGKDCKLSDGSVIALAEAGKHVAKVNCSFANGNYRIMNDDLDLVAETKPIVQTLKSGDTIKIRQMEAELAVITNKAKVNDSVRIIDLYMIEKMMAEGKISTIGQAKGFITSVDRNGIEVIMLNDDYITVKRNQICIIDDGNGLGNTSTFVHVICPKCHK